jgi:hypothetical protein
MKEHAWAEKIEAVGVVVIRGGDREAVLNALGAKRETEKLVTFSEAEAAWSDDAVPLQVWTSGDAVVVVEPNGYRSSLADTLEKMAPGKDAVSVFWNFNAEMQIMVLAAGKLVRTFDPLMYDDGESPLAEEAGLSFGSEDADLKAASMAFVERRLGVKLTSPEFLDEPHPTFAGLPA